jgi:hypothetical protein
MNMGKAASPGLKGTRTDIVSILLVYVRIMTESKHSAALFLLRLQKCFFNAGNNGVKLWVNEQLVLHRPFFASLIKNLM